MIPFLYFFRVTTTILCGFFLAQSIILPRIPSLNSIYLFLNGSSKSRFTLAFFSLAIGIISFITDRVYYNFLPSLMAIITAIIILYQEYHGEASPKNKFTEYVNKLGNKYHVQWGLASIIIGIIHLFAVNTPWL